MNFDPPFPVAAIVALGVLALGVAIWREISGKRRLTPGWLHPVCLFLRIAAIAALMVILLNPSMRIAAKRSIGRNVILLDASLSMSLAAEEGSRWDAAEAFAESAARKIDAAGKSASRVMTFSNELDAEETANIPAGRETNLASALERLLAGSIEDRPDHIVVASDGRIHDRKRLGAALGLANAAQVPISTRVFGIDSRPRNARLAAVQAPRMVRPRSPVSVYVDVEGSGIAADETLGLKLVDDEGEVLAQSEFTLPKSQVNNPENERPAEQVLVFESGLRTGRYQVELSVPGEPEVDLDDNRFSFSVEIATGKLRVLFLEGTHWKRTVGEKGHCWNDMELMTRAWEASGDIEHVPLTPWSQYLNEPNLAGVTFHNGEMLLDRTKGYPKTREELHTFDVLIVSDVPIGNFSADQMQWVVDWVHNRGGGFLMGGGNTTFNSGRYDKSPWEKIVPVDMKAYGVGNLHQRFEIDIPESVRSHPLWTVSPDPKENEKILEAHPIFTGMNHVQRAKPGALVLAMRSGVGEPVIAAQRYGRGRSVAFMPDPNGGSGTFYLDWGPEDSPVLSAKVRHIGLGHGRAFRFNEIVANTDYGPSPSHPSPWYAQYWVNMVRWLGENSVRWQRDKFAGRVVAAQAHRGKELAVAAEVLMISDVDELLALDVGARIDGIAGRRVRLLYDRDRREFTGELKVPSDLGGQTEVNVLFDVQVNGQTLSHRVAVGVHQGNPEFVHSSPDPQFMADLAQAAGGSVLESAADALESNRAALEKRRTRSSQSRSEPLWSQWWPWLVFAVCFCLEWALRRRGGRGESEGSPDFAPRRPMTKAAAFIVGPLFLSLCLSAAFAEDEKSIEDWVGQLGDEKVRLRDEAESFLRNQPDAHDALLALTEGTANKEAKARAEKILRHLTSHRWQLVAIRQGHTENKGEIFARGLIVSPNRTRLYSRARDFVRIWSAQTYEPVQSFGEPSFSIEEDGAVEGIARTLAISSDGRKIATTNEYSEIILHDFKTLNEITRFAVDEARPFIEKQIPYLEGIVLSAQFLHDRRRLVAGTNRGARMWDTETGKVLWKSGFEEPGFALVLTPDRKKVVICGDSPASNDSLYTLDLQTGRTLARLELPTRLGGLAFDSGGGRLVGYGRDGFARVYDFDPVTGGFSNERSYGPNAKECQGVVWGPDETTILVTCWNPRQAMTEWDLETGDPVWKAPPLEFGLSTTVWIDRERLAILGSKGLLTVWEFTGDSD